MNRTQQLKETLARADIDDPEVIAAHNNAYRLSMHAMQTGVTYVMTRDPKETQPKHLRVGVNAALVDAGALARLLIAKGIITEGEYAAALAQGARIEHEMYEERVNELLVDGKGRITLG